MDWALAFHPGRIALALFAALSLALLALVLSIHGHKRAAALYRRHFAESRRERQMLAAVGFYLAFAIARVVAHAIRAGIGPFRNVAFEGRHIHHLVFGIALLLVVGYGWLLETGSVSRPSSQVTGRLMALLYGVGAALTLDEFALWLNLRDVYWAAEGRQSIDAVILFGVLLLIGVIGGKFVRALVREALKPARHVARVARIRRSG